MPRHPTTTDTVGAPLFFLALSRVSRRLLMRHARRQNACRRHGDHGAMRMLGIMGGCSGPKGLALIDLIRIREPLTSNCLYCEA